MRSNTRATFLAVNVLLVLSIFWLVQLSAGPEPALAITALMASIQGSLWWLTVRRGELAPQENNRLVSVLERSAHARRFTIRDEATGLLNRWYFDRRLSEEAARCRRYGYPMAVVVLKVAVPDLSGMSIDNWQEQSAGAAQRCLKEVREVDLAALLSPFEFAICLVQCNREGAQRVIRRVADEMEEYECTAGLASVPEDECEPGALVEVARVRSQPVGGKVA